MTGTPPDWHVARAAMHLDPVVTMLNTGSFGPLPRPVFDRVTDLRLQLAAGPTDFFVRRVPPLLWHARKRLADFLGIVPHQLVFTANVSAAINLVAAGLTLPTTGELLLTDHEYLAMRWVWERAARRRGLTLRTFPLPTMPANPGEVVDAAARAMTPRTRLFFFSHVLSPTGLVLPAKALCTEARRRGIFTVVDGAHAAAMLPLDVTDVGADFYAGNCHKWLLAPTGTGFLAVGSGNEDRLEPLHVSWGYYPDRYPLGEPTDSAGPDAPDAYGSTARTRFLEFEGTRDVCPWLACPEAIDFQARLGWENIRSRHRELAAYTRRQIGERFGLRLATPPAASGGLTAFELPPEANAAEWRQRLWDARIEVPIVERPNRLLLRVSHHFYNGEADIDRLADVVGRILGR